MHFPTSPYLLPHYATFTPHSCPHCLCWLVSICTHSTATFCSSLACSVPLRGVPKGTTLAHLASLVDSAKERHQQVPGRWEDREARLCLSAPPLPSCWPGAHISSRGSVLSLMASAIGHRPTPRHCHPTAHVSPGIHAVVPCACSLEPQVLTASYCC